MRPVSWTANGTTNIDANVVHEGKNFKGKGPHCLLLPEALAKVSQHL
jgi:hypothetical protein